MQRAIFLSSSRPNRALIAGRLLLEFDVGNPHGAALPRTLTLTLILNPNPDPNPNPNPSPNPNPNPNPSPNPSPNPNPNPKQERQLVEGGSDALQLMNLLAFCTRTFALPKH